MLELIRRLHFLLTRRRRERELDDELAFHREMADRAAATPLGDSVRIREDARETWGWMWLDRLAQDLAYAVRLLVRSPGFALAAVATLGVGIGVNVAAFGLFNLIALKPLPVRDPDSLLRFERRAPEAYASDLAYPHMTFLADHATTVSSVLAIHQARLATDRGEKPIRVHFVTANYFADLGAGAAAGRLVQPGLDEVADAGPAVVLSHAYWTRQFGASATIVGATMRLNGRPATVLGVASEEFSGLTLGSPDVWAPIRQQPYFLEGSRLLEDMSAETAGVKMWARRRPGVAPASVEAELAALTATLRAQYPDQLWTDETLPSFPGGYATMGRGTSRGTGSPPDDSALAFLALGGALVLLILCVACANLGGLLLARGVSRERELSIRVAVGAGAGRLVRQLFTESVLLGLLGAASGVALSSVLLRAIAIVSDAPEWLDLSPDWRVLLFAAGLGMLSSLLFGLAPALQVVRRRHGTRRLRQALVAVQVAASAVLLVVSGLLLRAMERGSSTPPGFNYEQVVAIAPRLSDYGFSGGASQVYIDALTRRLAAHPAAAAVAIATVPPLGGVRSVARVERNGAPVDVHLNRVDPNYFRTMRIPILRGRGLAESDARAVVVSESLALRYWPAEDPLGQQYDGHTVIGVAGSARTAALQDSDAVEAYYLRTPDDLPVAVVLVRSTADPESLAAAAAGVAASIDPKVYADIRLLKSAFDERIRQTKMSALAVAGLGVSAMALACLGIVGLVAYTVSQRTREIGIRMALGAPPIHVLSVVLGQLSHPVMGGLIGGMLAAAGLSLLLRRELYGVSHLDPVAYLSAAGVFVAVAVAAALLPARRALKVDPLRALRTD